MSEDPNLHRRHDDFVSYRDMVEYFAKQEAEWHTMRAESFVIINAQLEKLDKRLEKSVEDFVETFRAHEEWHRNVLQGLIDRGPQNRLSVAAIITAIIGIVVSASVAISLGVLHAHN